METGQCHCEMRSFIDATQSTEEGNMKKLFIASVTVWLCLGFSGAGIVQAADKYPVKPIVFIVPGEAGGEWIHGNHGRASV